MKILDSSCDREITSSKTFFIVEICLLTKRSEPFPVPSIFNRQKSFFIQKVASSAAANTPTLLGTTLVCKICARFDLSLDHPLHVVREEIRVIVEKINPIEDLLSGSIEVFSSDRHHVRSFARVLPVAPRTAALEFIRTVVRSIAGDEHKIDRCFARIRPSYVFRICFTRVSWLTSWVLTTKRMVGNDVRLNTFAGDPYRVFHLNEVKRVVITTISKTPRITRFSPRAVQHSHCLLSLLNSTQTLGKISVSILLKGNLNSNCPALYSHQILVPRRKTAGTCFEPGSGIAMADVRGLLASKSL